MSHKDHIDTYAILYGYYEGYMCESKYHKMRFTTSNVFLNTVKYIYILNSCLVTNTSNCSVHIQLRAMLFHYSNGLVILTFHNGHRGWKKWCKYCARPSA